MISNLFLLHILECAQFSLKPYETYNKQNRIMWVQNDYTSI